MLTDIEWPWVVSALHGDGEQYAELGDRFVGTVRNGVAAIEARCANPEHTQLWQKAVAQCASGTNLIRGELGNGTGFVIQRVSLYQVVCTFDYPNTPVRATGGWTADEGDTLDQATDPVNHPVA